VFKTNLKTKDLSIASDEHVSCAANDVGDWGQKMIQEKALADFASTTQMSCKDEIDHAYRTVGQEIQNVIQYIEMVEVIYQRHIKSEFTEVWQVCL
jgi:cobalamin-dependent methionine synthase I